MKTTISWAPLILGACLVFVLSYCSERNGKDSKQSVVSSREEQESYRLREVGATFLEKGLIDSAIPVLMKALTLSKLDTAKAACYNNLGYALERKQKYKQAIDTLVKAEDIYRKLKDTVRLALVELNIARTLKILGVYDIAAAKTLNAIGVLAKTPSHIQDLSIAYTLIGNIHREIADYAGAINYHQRSLSIWRKFNDSSGFAAALNNLGNVYLDKGIPDSALWYFSKYGDISRQLGNKLKLARAYQNLGKTFLANNSKVEARQALDSAHSIFSLLGNKYGLLDVELLNTDYYWTDDIAKALAHGEEAKRLSNSLDVANEKAQAFHKLAILYGHSGQSGLAYNYSSEYQRINDSILSKEKISRIHANELKFEMDNHRVEIEKRESEKRDAVYKSEISSQQRNFAFMLVMLIGSLLFILYRRYIEKRRLNAILIHQNDSLNHQNQSLNLIRGELEAENALLFQSVSNRIVSDGIFFLDKRVSVKYKNIIKIVKRDKEEHKNDSQVWYVDEIRGGINSKMIYDRSLKDLSNDQNLPDYLFAQISGNCIINLTRIVLLEEDGDAKLSKWDFYYNDPTQETSPVIITVNRSFHKGFKARFDKFKTSLG